MKPVAPRSEARLPLNDLAPHFRRRHDPKAEADARRRRVRMSIVASFVAAAFGIVGARLVHLGVEAQTNPVRQVAQLTGHGPRAPIVDREGRLLARDVLVPSIAADARKIWDIDETVLGLSSALPNFDAETARSRLESGRAFVWLARNVTRAEADRVYRLGLPGVMVSEERSRRYPNGRTAAHAIGYVDIDGRGLAGLERSFDAGLAGGLDGGALATSLDLAVQHTLERELGAAMARFSAIGAAGLVMDITTGEMLAMASLPALDPNQPGQADDAERFNRITLGAYEMGSTYKAFTAAMALELNGATLETMYDAAKPIRFGRHTINDYKPKARTLSLVEVFRYSSNIGSAHIAMQAGPAEHRAFLERFGQLAPAPLEIREKAEPIRWGEIETMTISFGHGLSVTPVHLAMGVGALLNGGRLIPPTLLKRRAGQAVEGEAVISPATSEAMRVLFRDVVVEGTAKSAEVEGYPVGGKTGSAEKAAGGGYARKALLSSFIGTFPADAPRYLVLVILDEPKGTKETHGYATGGWTAAPTAGKVIREIAPMLGMMPRVPEPPAPLPGKPMFAARPG